MPHTVAKLNDLLARALGRNPYGEGMFRWEWSEDLFWPEFPTGRTLSRDVEIPVIGGAECAVCKGTGIGWSEGESEHCLRCAGSGKVYMETVSVPAGPEYRKEKMAPHLDHQWVITVWYPPELLAHYAARFPGAAYPARGHRIVSNASLPSFPGGPREPNLHETNRYIDLLNYQRNHTHYEVEHGIDDERTARDKSVNKEIQDEIKDSFPAQMNLNPGARGGWVSFPYSKKDRIQ